MGRVVHVDSNKARVESACYGFNVCLTLEYHVLLSTYSFNCKLRRYRWVHVRPLNFPQPEELAAYPAQARERCDERGLALSLAPELPAGTEGATATQGAASQQRPPLSARKPPCSSGFFGVSKDAHTCHEATPWRAEVSVPGATKTTKMKSYVVGYFATKEEAARWGDAG
jgi:hypothetical protein